MKYNGMLFEDTVGVYMLVKSDLTSGTYTVVRLCLRSGKSTSRIGLSGVRDEEVEEFLERDSTLLCNLSDSIAEVYLGA